MHACPSVALDWGNINVRISKRKLLKYGQFLGLIVYAFFSFLYKAEDERMIEERCCMTLKKMEFR